MIIMVIVKKNKVMMMEIMMMMMTMMMISLKLGMNIVFPRKNYKKGEKSKKKDQLIINIWFFLLILQLVQSNQLNSMKH